MKPLQIAAVGLFVIIGAFVIGLTNPTLTPATSTDSSVQCGMAWGSENSDLADSGQSSCAPIRSERFAWSIALAAVGVGLLAAAAVGASGIASGPTPQSTQNAAGPPNPPQQ